MQSAADFQFSVLMQAMNAYGKGKHGHKPTTQQTDTGATTSITGTAT